MKAIAIVLASALLACGAVLALPGAAAIQCTGGIPPDVDATYQCVLDLQAWVEDELDDLPPPNDE